MVENFKDLSQDKRSDKKLALAAVKEDGYNLKYVSEELKKDKDVVKEAINSYPSSLELADISLKKDKEFLLPYIKKNGYMIHYIDASLLKDRKIIESAVKQFGNLLEFANKSFKEDKDFVLEIVKDSGLALRHVSDKLKDDKQVVLAAISENIFALDYASKRLKKDDEVLAIFNEKIKQKDLVKKSKEKFIKYFDGGSLSEYEDYNVVEYIIEKEKYGIGLCSVEKRLQDDDYIVSKAVENNPLALCFASKRLRNDINISLEAVQKNGLALVFVGDELKNNTKVITTAVEENEKVLQCTNIKMLRHYERKKFKSNEFDKKDFDNDFEDDYINNLMQIKKLYNELKKLKNPYHDPDEVKSSDKVFYNDLQNFLNVQNDKVSLENKLEFSFNKKLNVLEEKNSNMFLTSDQFGFSAPHFNGKGISAWYSDINCSYPYSKYIELSEYKKEAYTLVAKCVNDTRTVGGSFIWPKVGTKTKLSYYNRSRGVASYIEDSVDLTLFEIKRFYEIKKDNESNSDIIKKMNDEKFILLSNTGDNEQICEWLKLFGTFENYIKYFCFESFVDKDYNVIDIYEANDLNYKNEAKKGFCESKAKLDIKKVKNYQKKKWRIEGTKEPQKLELLIKNVRLLTVRRSAVIQKLLDI